MTINEILETFCTCTHNEALRLQELMSSISDHRLFSAHAWDHMIESNTWVLCFYVNRGPSFTPCLPSEKFGDVPRKEVKADELIKILENFLTTEKL